MPEAYIFSTATSAQAAESLGAALRSAGLTSRALAEVVWLGPAPSDLPGDFPLVALPDGSPHFALQAVLRRLQAGERGLFAFGQSAAPGSVCLILGGPAVVGRLNLLPAYRLHPAPTLPTDAAEAAESFRLALAPPPAPEEPTPENAPPQIISPAMPPPQPPAAPEPPEIRLLLCENGDPALYPAARRLPANTGLPALLDLIAALSGPETDAGSWGALVTPLTRGLLLTVAEKL